MKIYLCSRYGRKEEMLSYANRLASNGHIITSSWLVSQLDDDPEDVNERASIAAQNFNDILNSDVIICFTEPPGSLYARGGRHVELGIALGHGIQPIVVGFRENVFACLGDVVFAPSILDAVDHLGTMRQEMKGANA